MAKCTCSGSNVVFWVLQAVAYAVALYLIVNGVELQRLGGLWYEAIAWSAAGFFVFGIGKYCKWRSHQGCPVHQY